MQIKLGTFVAVGGAYLVGYSRGMTASDNLGNQIGDGLAKIGEGLKALALELGLDYKKYQEEKEKFGEKISTDDSLSTEAKVLALAQRRDLFRSDDQIADLLDIQVEEVKLILGEDGPQDIDGNEASESSEPSAEEIEQYAAAHGIDDRGKQEITYHGMSAPSQGEPPDQPGSDAS